MFVAVTDPVKKLATWIPATTAEEGNVVLHAGDIEIVQCSTQPVDCRVAIRAGGDELGDQRIIIDADLGTLEDPGIEPDALAGGWQVPYEPPDRRQKIARRVLGVDPRFDRPAGKRDIVLAEGRARQLQQIMSSTRSGPVTCSVTDAPPGGSVHLEEIEIALPIDMNSACRPAVVDGTRQRDRYLHGFPNCRGRKGWASSMTFGGGAGWNISLAEWTMLP